MARILTIGATGLLGSTLAPVLSASSHSVVTHGFTGLADEKADLCDFAQTTALIERVKPDCIINLAAMTNVDLCELEPHRAYLLNVYTVSNLARAIKEKAPNCHLVQISTDQVYDGHGPSLEANVTVTNTYALTKIAAELAAISVSSTILRTTFFGRSLCASRSSFSDWIVKALLNDTQLNVFDDILFSPLEIKTLASMIERVVCMRPVGLFNLGAREGMSKADFAFALADVMTLPTKNIIRTLSTTSPALNAYRPKDMRMDSSLFERTMGLQLPTLIDQVNSLRNDYYE
jgi:dTDP-4-dehydrorhamnose reductase